MRRRLKTVIVPGGRGPIDSLHRGLCVYCQVQLGPPGHNGWRLCPCCGWWWHAGPDANDFRTLNEDARCGHVRAIWERA